jgi:hypothetical protein
LHEIIDGARRCHIFGGKAAVLSEAVGTHFTAKGEKGEIYSW